MNYVYHHEQFSQITKLSIIVHPTTNECFCFDRCVCVCFAYVWWSPHLYLINLNNQLAIKIVCVCVSPIPAHNWFWLGVFETNQALFIVQAIYIQYFSCFVGLKSVYSRIFLLPRPINNSSVFMCLPVFFVVALCFALSNWTISYRPRRPTDLIHNTI